MSNIAKIDKNIAAVEAALVKNDISKLGDSERMAYYKSVCDSVGLNPMTKPFAFLQLQGKVVLYATKDCSEQLRKIHGVSTQIMSQGVDGDLYTVHIKAKDRSGREDEDIAVIPCKGITGADLANLRMKAITKAKRRVTLSICGLGILDESELDTLQGSYSPTRNPQIQSPFKKEDEPEFETPEITLETPVLGEYVCKIGKKYIGKRLDEIDQFELDNYRQWLLDKATEQNKQLTGDWKEFVDRAEEYLKSKEPQTYESGLDELK